MRSPDYSSPQEQEQPLMTSRTQYTEESWRYCNVILYIIMSSFCDFQFFPFTLLTTQISQMYGVSTSLTFWYSSAFLLGSLVFSIPGGIFGAKLSMKNTLALAVGLNLLGTWLKVFINTSFYFSLLGEYIVALAYPVFRINVTKMSVQWFSSVNRPIATSILALGSFCLTITSSFLTTLAINKNNIDSSEVAYYKHRLFIYLVIFAIIASVVSLICLFLYREKPSEQPSFTSSIQRLQLKESCSHLRRNPSGILLYLSFGLMVGVNVSYQAVMEAAFRKYGADTLAIRWYTLASIPLCLIITPVVAKLSGKFGIFKLFFNLGNFVCVASYLALLLLYKSGGAFLFGAVYVFTMFPYSNGVSVGIEYISEVLFPIPESISAGIFVFSMKSCSFVIVQISSALIQADYLVQMNLLYLFIQVISTILLLVAKGKMRRREIDLKEEEDSRSESKL